MENKTKQKEEIIEIEKLVGANIKLRRLMLGITLDEMTKSLGVSLQQLGKYEKGINRISAGKLFILSELLNVPIDCFYNQIEESKKLLDENKPLQSLVRAFYKIKNQEERKSIIKLTKAMAKEA